MTAVHEVTNYLVTLVSGALPDVQVLDGWNRTEELRRKVVAVGHPPDFNAPAIRSEERFDEGGLCATVEHITVHCSAVSWDGEMEYTIKRGHVSQMVKAIRAAIAADIDLGGLCEEAWFAQNFDWHQVADEKGTTVQVDFAIDVTVHAT